MLKHRNEIVKKLPETHGIQIVRPYMLANQ
jgi:hypothetical protein